MDLSFFQRKYANLKNEAAVNGKAVSSILINRIVDKLFKAFLLFVNFALLICFIPIFLFCFLLLFTQRRKKKSTILFVGLEHIIKKTTDRAKLFTEKGYQVHFYSLESTKLKYKEEFKNQLYKTSPILVFNVLQFISDLYRKRICYVEVYLESSFLELLLFQVCCKVSNTLCIVIERGMMINLELKNVGKIFRLFLKWIYLLSDKIYYREPYMLNHFRHLGIPNNKLYFDYNKVPINEQELNPRKGNKTLLFLNSFVPSRRLDIFIGAIPQIQKEFPDANFLIVGARSDEEMNFAQHLLDKFKVGQNVNVYTYTNNPKSFYDRADIFVFPSDFVFANFSLLEAMENGLVPVVSKVRDADKIIDHGINGFLLPQSPEEFAAHCRLLLRDESLRVKMGYEARRKIISSFNDISRIDSIDQLICTLYKKTNNN